MPLRVRIAQDGPPSPLGEGVRARLDHAHDGLDGFRLAGGNPLMVERRDDVAVSRGKAEGT
jgi:hypothetical protein